MEKWYDALAVFLYKARDNLAPNNYFAYDSIVRSLSQSFKENDPAFKRSRFLGIALFGEPE